MFIPSMTLIQNNNQKCNKEICIFICIYIILNKIINTTLLFLPPLPKAHTPVL